MILAILREEYRWWAGGRDGQYIFGAKFVIIVAAELGHWCRVLKTVLAALVSRLRDFSVV